MIKEIFLKKSIPKPWSNSGFSINVGKKEIKMEMSNGIPLHFFHSSTYMK